MTSLAQSTYERILKDIFEYGKNGNTRYGDKARNRSGARDLVTNRVADLYVEAGSNFRMTDIGPKRLVSDTCYVLAFRKGFANKLDILIPRLLYNRGTIHHINGTDVIEYKPRRLRKLPQTDSYWITMPQPNTLVIATRMSLLTRVLGDPTPNSPAVFPETLKAWDHISPSSKAWGLRHYTENVAATDISDVRVLSLGSEGADNDTLGTVSAFAFDLNAKTGSGRAVWLDCDRSVSNFVVESFKHRVADIGGEYTESPNGTVAMSITWSDDAEGTKTSMRLARWISWFMGHAGII